MEEGKQPWDPARLYVSDLVKRRLRVEAREMKVVAGLDWCPRFAIRSSENAGLAGNRSSQLQEGGRRQPVLCLEILLLSARNMARAQIYTRIALMGSRAVGYLGKLFGKREAGEENKTIVVQEHQARWECGESARLTGRKFSMNLLRKEYGKPDSSVCPSLDPPLLPMASGRRACGAREMASLARLLTNN